MIGLRLGPIGARCLRESTLLLFSLTSGALAAGTISGTVKAPTGWSASGSIITATAARYHLFRTTAAADGAYTLGSLDPGAYTLTVAAKGLEIAPLPNVVVAEGQTLEQDLTLAAAQPFCVVKSFSPIPLTDDIDSPAFDDAPDIHVDTAANLVEPVGNLPMLNMWGGPATVGGRFRIKYSTAGIHLAADLTYKTPGVNLAGLTNQFLGNAIEFDFQNDPYDPTRTAYDNDHNWRLVIGLGATPQWWLYGGLQQAPMVDGKAEPLGSDLLIKNRPNNDGQLVRVDLPWAIFLKGDKMTPIAPPGDLDLGAAELAVEQSGPDSTQDRPTSRYRLTWSGFDTGFQEPDALKPIQFCLQAPFPP